MAKTIILKKSSVAGKIPEVSDLQIGEIAVNLTDRKLYTKNSNNEIVLLKGDTIYDTGLQDLLDLKAALESPIFTQSVTVIGNTLTDRPTYGAELLTSGGWTVNSGWTEDPNDTFAHSSGTSTLENSAEIIDTKKYQIVWTVSTSPTPNGSFSISGGGQTRSGIVASGSWGPTATSNTTFVITPTTDFDGTISAISLKEITAGSNPGYILKDSSGDVQFEIRINEGIGNSFVGSNCGKFNTTGLYNTGIGVSALNFNTTGLYNTVIGSYAGYFNTTGTHNTLIGVNAGAANRSGSYNTAIGVLSSLYNISGSYNTATGYYTLLNNTVSYNTAFGYNSLKTNTTGPGNSGFGYNSLRDNSIGSDNSAFGSQAMSLNIDGIKNTAFGESALYAKTTGDNNVAIGAEAGLKLEGGSNLGEVDNSIFIGYDTRAKANGDTNSIVIGNQAIGEGSNTTVLGNSSTLNTHIFGNLITTDPVNVKSSRIDTDSTGVNNTSETVIYSYDSTEYRTAELIVQVDSNSTDFHSTKILLIHNGTTVQLVQYGTISNNGELGTFDAVISSGDVQLTFTATASTTKTVKVLATMLSL